MLSHAAGKPRRQSGPGWNVRRSDLLFLGVFIVAIAGGFAAVALTPPKSGPVAIIVMPWSSGPNPMEVVSAADGRYLRQGAADWIVIAASDEPGFADRLYGAGAWIVANPLAAGGCLSQRRARGGTSI